MEKKTKAENDGDAHFQRESRNSWACACQCFNPVKAGLTMRLKAQNIEFSRDGSSDRYMIT